MATKKETKKQAVDTAKPETINEAPVTLVVNERIAQSIDVLIQAVEIAQRKGAYSLQDAYLINIAVSDLAPYRLKEPEPVQVEETNKEKEK